jgi:hypothetical protein
MAFLLPLVGFVIWQLIPLHATGEVPVFKSGGENLGVPFVGFARGLRHYLTLFPSTVSGLWFGELGVFTLIAVSASTTPTSWAGWCCSIDGVGSGHGPIICFATWVVVFVELVRFV